VLTATLAWKPPGAIDPILTTCEAIPHHVELTGVWSAMAGMALK